MTSFGSESLAFASHNDPLMRFAHAEYWARAWGSELVEVGEAGHINAGSGFGPWDFGLTRVGQFAKQVINKFNE
ncbi:putative alpha/beta hydrolase family esterase [Serratia sp. 509]